MRNLLGRLRSVVRWRGVGYFGYLLTGVLLPRLVAKLLYGMPSSGALSAAILRTTPSPKAPEEAPPPAHRFVRAETWLPAETWRAVAEELRRPGSEPLVLGALDNDGRLLSLCGPVPDFDEVSEAEFAPRYRYGVDLVVEDGRVLVRKSYRGDRAGFLREWASLARLQGQGGPALHRADEDRLEVYKALLPGPTLRQRLVAAGARILSVETDADPELLRLEGTQRLEAVWQRGREHFSALPPGTVASLERQLVDVHRQGVTGFGLTYGNVVLVGPEKTPQFLDFDAAEVHSPASGLRLALARDRDRALFRRIYGTDLLTEASARALLRRVATAYSPVDLGRGLVTKGFWSVDSGTGRWESLNARALRGRIEGRRILDLGSFNALMPLLMLAAGARQVVALEASEDMIPVGRELQRLFEWRDQGAYDLDLRCADMRAILDGDWGLFDLVTAFCSLYYLDEEDMARMVRRAAELAPTLVLQAKVDTRDDAPEGKAHKSSLEFLRSLMGENGFTDVEIIAPEGFSRPLLIGGKRYGG